MGRHQTVRQGDGQQIQRDRRRSDWQRSRGSKYSVQLPPSPPKPQLAAVEPSYSPVSEPRPRLSVQILAGLTRRPMALVLMVWLLSVVTAGVAAFNMLAVDPSYDSSLDLSSEQSPSLLAPREAFAPVRQKQELPERPVERPNHSKVSAEREETSPLFSLGVAVFSCVMGSLLISRCFRSRSAASDRKQLPAIPQRLPRTVSTFPKPVVNEYKNPAELQTQDTIYSHEQTTDRPVTVVSDEEGHPLDWDEPSLADYLDLRQKRPLSYWLQQKL